MSSKIFACSLEELLIKQYFSYKALSENDRKILPILEENPSLSTDYIKIKKNNVMIDNKQFYDLNINVFSGKNKIEYMKFALMGAIVQWDSLACDLTIYRLEFSSWHVYTPTIFSRLENPLSFSTSTFIEWYVKEEDSLKRLPDYLGKIEEIDKMDVFILDSLKLKNGMYGIDIDFHPYDEYIKNGFYFEYEGLKGYAIVLQAIKTKKGYKLKNILSRKGLWVKNSRSISFGLPSKKAIRWIKKHNSIRYL